MNSSRFRGRRTLLGAGVALTMPLTTARAGTRFPERPIRMIVPWAPGGPTDAQMRALCEAAARRLGQPVLVENRPGAGGTLGALHLAREARPDGYTLGQMPNGVFRLPALTDRPQWDPIRDFTYVLRLVGYMGGIVVRADAPWPDLGALLAEARAHPGKFSYGTPGVLTSDVQMTQLARMAGIEWVPVPFRGAAPNLQALLAGDVHFVAETSAWAEMALQGKVRPLALWMRERAARFPHVPTLIELGFPIDGESSYGIAGPRGMDPEIVARLHDAFRDALHDPIHRAMIARFDMPIRYLGTEDYRAHVATENEAEKRLMAAIGAPRN